MPEHEIFLDPVGEKVEAGNGDRSARPRSRAIVAVALIVGLAIGWILALGFGGDAKTESAQELSPEEPAPTVVPGVPNDAPSAAADEPANRRATPLNLEAEVTLLGIDALAGPVTLLPGFGGSTAVRINPTGQAPLSLVYDVSGSDGIVPEGEFNGLAVGELDDGVLFIPHDHALGAVAFWNERDGVTLPLPSAAYDTSFLAAAGDLGVFRSGGDVVVQDLAERREQQRLPAEIDGSPVVHACLGPTSDVLALVSSEGSIAVYDLASGAEVATASTTTPRFGVAWAGADQLVWLGNDAQQDKPMVMLFDLADETRTGVALLGNTSWTLETLGTGC